MPLLLRLYFAFAAVSAPVWWLAQRILQRRGREDRARGAEKWGHASVARPGGRVVWFHAASVGEALALVTLLGRLTQAQGDLSVVLTTQTLASAQALALRGLPDRVIHQFAPADHPGAIDRFLRHWQPQALIVAESELWPVMLHRAGRAGLPRLLINTQMSAARAERRRRRLPVTRWLLGCFDRILVQDEASRQRLQDLGVAASRMQVAGVLKAASDPLPDHPAERAALWAMIGARPCWLAASTKAAEEPQVIAAQALALAELPDLLLLIAPRQTTEADRTEAAARTLFARGAIARRSRGEAITAATRVYIADTFGEMGLWYRLAPVTFIGNTLPVADHSTRGHNPFEPMRLNSMTLIGPCHSDVAVIVDDLASRGALALVEDAADLARAVVLAQEPARRAPWLTAAAEAIAAHQAPLTITLAAVEAVLAPGPGDSASAVGDRS